MDFKTKNRIIGECFLLTRSDPEWEALHNHADMSLVLGYAISTGYAKPTPKGTALINNVYDLILEVLDIPDAEYYDFGEMLQANIDKQE